MNRRRFIIMFGSILSALLISCSSPYPESEGVYVYHSSGCDTLKQGVLKGKQIQHLAIFQIKSLSGLSFHDIDSVIIKFPETDKDSVGFFKLKHEKGDFIRGAGRMTKWKPELWIYDHDIPVHAESIPDQNNIYRIYFQERLSAGVYAICIKKHDSGLQEIHYYDFKVK